MKCSPFAVEWKHCPTSLLPAASAANSPFRRDRKDCSAFGPFRSAAGSSPSSSSLPALNAPPQHAPPSLSAAPSDSETAETAETSARRLTSAPSKARRSGSARSSPPGGSLPPSPRRGLSAWGYVKNTRDFYPKAGVAEALRACCSRSMVSRMVFRRTWVSSRRRLRSSLRLRGNLERYAFSRWMAWI